MSDANEIALPFTPAEWQVIQAGLYELPMKHAAPVANKLQQRLADALRPKPAKPLKEAS